MKLSFLTPNSALRVILKLLIPHCALLIIFNSCFLTAKYNHPMDGIGGIILNAVLLNTTRNASLAQTVVLTGLPSVITEGQSASVDVKLALATTSSIQVTLTLDNPAITVDGLASKVLTFSPENATVNQTIKLAAVTDTNKISELVTMKVTATGLADQTVSISTIDNTPLISVSNPPTSVNEGGTATFGVKLGGTISSDTKVTITSSNTTSVSIAPANLTFTSSNATTDQTVTISGVEDNNGTSESVTITLTAPSLVDVTLNLTVTDNDCYTWGCFAENENGTISFTGARTFEGTNLVWMKCPQGQTYDSTSKACIGTAGQFKYCSTGDNACDNGIILNGTGISTAYDTCNLLNTNPVGGYTGITNWRVPSKDELRSLVYCSNGPVTPLLDGISCQNGSVQPTINNWFSANGGGYYMSSSSLTTTLEFGVNFSQGSIANLVKLQSLYVRCVSTSP